MGEAQCSLGIHLTSAGCEVALTQRPTAPRLGDFTQEERAALQEVFTGLGGLDTLPTLRTGAWDLWVDGILVELDEAQHFNRYRAQTLAAPWAADLPWVLDFQQYCRDHEGDCLKKARHGGYWTSPSTERWFGPPAPRGDLDSPGGSPRWKQRAFYDAVKDAFAAGSATWAVARVSVYDDVAGVPLGTTLTGRSAPHLGALRALVAARTTNPAALLME